MNFLRLPELEYVVGVNCKEHKIQFQQTPIVNNSTLADDLTVPRPDRQGDNR